MGKAERQPIIIQTYLRLHLESVYLQQLVLLHSIFPLRLVPDKVLALRQYMMESRKLFLVVNKINI